MKGHVSSEEPEAKKPALLGTGDLLSPTQSKLTVFQDPVEEDLAIHFEMAFIQGSPEGVMELHVKYLGGSLGIDAMHQVVQYLKNKYSKHTCSVSSELTE